MTIQGALHPRADVNHTYVPQNQGGHGLKSIEGTVLVKEQQLKHYVLYSEKSSSSEWQQMSFITEVSRSSTHPCQLGARLGESVHNGLVGKKLAWTIPTIDK